MFIRKHCECELKECQPLTPATYRWFSEEISSGQRKITDELKSSNPLLSTDPPSRNWRRGCSRCRCSEKLLLFVVRGSRVQLWVLRASDTSSSEVRPLHSHLFWDMLAGWACFLGQRGPLPWPDVWDVWSWAAQEKGSAMLFPRALAGPPSEFGLRSGDRGLAWAPERKKGQRCLVLLWGWREERHLHLSWLLPS